MWMMWIRMSMRWGSGEDSDDSKDDDHSHNDK